jgi:hypothetical protein
LRIERDLAVLPDILRSQSQDRLFSSFSGEGVNLTCQKSLMPSGRSQTISSIPLGLSLLLDHQVFHKAAKFMAENGW